MAHSPKASDNDTEATNTVCSLTAYSLPDVVFDVFSAESAQDET